jgi:hypothetical protein
MTVVIDKQNTNLLTINQEFPRIGQALDLFWGSPEFTQYTDQLLSDTRGNRKGFPSDILLAIINMQTLHDTQFPQYAKQHTDIWM